MNAAALLALLRAKVKAEGPGAPFFVEQRDAYTQEPTDEPLPVLRGEPADDGYCNQKPIPLGGPSPVVRLFADAHGIVGGTIDASEPEDDTPDLHRREQMKVYGKRARHIAEWGDYPGISTEINQRRGVDPE